MTTPDEVLDQQDDGSNPAPPARQQQQQSNDGKGEDWQAKYNGLNGTVVKQKNKIAELQSKIDDLNERYEGLNVDHKELKKQHDAKTKEATDAASENVKLKRQIDVGKTIRLQYKPLADLYDEGLLRIDDLEGDALKEYLTKYAERLGQAARAANDEGSAGSPPPPPAGGNTPNRTLADIRKDLNTATAKGVQSPEYRQFFKEYQEALQSARQQQGS